MVESMHEIGILEQVVESVCKTARDNNISEVTQINLDVGELAGVIPEIFTDYFPMFQEKEPVIAKAKINLHPVRAEALCEDCGALYHVTKFNGKCPKCESPWKKILGGKGVVLKGIEY